MFGYNPITGFIEFALPIHLNAPQKDIDEIYTDSIMKARFHLLENICLPSIKAQTDQDFKIVILSFARMPEVYKSGLLMLTEDNPNIVVDFLGHKSTRNILKSHIAAANKNRFGSVINFNLRPDCAISCHYIRNLRQISQNLTPLTIVSFPKGIMVYQDETGAVISKPHLFYCNEDGLANVSSSGFRISTRQLKQGSLSEKFPIVSDPSFAAYIKIQHFFGHTDINKPLNIAEVNSNPPNIVTQNPIVERLLKENFPYVTQEKLHETISFCIDNQKHAYR